ncbi:hypothetical protein TNCV_19071 [Trichonephila clavipes]|nr:hypothetical protein TNCV_19071 [Trichonephila clavipes]
MAHIDITVVPHNTLNYSRGVISAADLLNVSTEEIKENMVDQKSVKAPISIALFDLTFQIRSVAFNAKDLVIQKQSAAASQPALDVQSQLQWIHVRLYPLHLTVKKTRKARIKESGVQSHKKEVEPSKNSMTWETMSWTFTPRKRRKSYGRSAPPRLRLLAPCEEQVRRLHDLLYLLELPWFKDSTC